MPPLMMGVMDSSSQALSSVRVSSSISLQLLEDGLELGRQLLVFRLEARPGLLGELLLLDQGLELGEGDGLVLDDRDEVGLDEQPHLDLDDREALLGRLLLEPLEDVLLFFCWLSMMASCFSA